MNRDLEALLALQADDNVLGELDNRARVIATRVTELDRARADGLSALEQARAAISIEEKRQRDLQLKVTEHKHLQDRNLAQLDSVRKPKEADAAMTQIDVTRRVLAQEESDLHGIAARLRELRDISETRELELGELEEQQKTLRAEIADQSRIIARELEQAQAKREGTASHASPRSLALYERLRKRNSSEAIHPLRGTSCGNCNTAIPLQRRNIIASGKQIETCEGCGVILYATV